MPARFLIKCNTCRWVHESSGLAKDLERFKEVRPTCSGCGRPRKFICPECRGVAVMKRVGAL